jgi:hypothetical protein
MFEKGREASTQGEVIPETVERETPSLQKTYKELELLRNMLAGSIDQLDWLVNPKPKDAEKDAQAGSNLGNANMPTIDNTVSVLKWQADRISKQLNQLRFGKA